jgi:Flp pilus assembly protein TadG
MKAYQIKKRLTGFREEESGNMAVIMALLLVVLLSMSALAVDYGHMAWVQHELKTAADAGALAGARSLVPYIGSPATPNWLAAQNKATETVLLNTADGKALTICTVQYGYWSLTAKTLQSTGIVPTSTDLPAVQVKVAKNAGENGGAIQMFFAPIFGVQTHDLSGQGMAVISGPSTVLPGNAFPMAMPKRLVDQYWNREPPVSFKVGSAYQDPDGGQWTSFFTDANDVPTIRDLIANGNPSSLKVGDNIWIEPGTKTTLYDDASSKIGQTVIVPVVDTDLSTHGYTPILGFASFNIEAAEGGSGKYIQGHLVKQIINDTGSGGPIFGTFLPAVKLVN